MLCLVSCGEHHYGHPFAGNFPAISDDLVNSYHLLLCCIDWFFANALLGARKDLLKPDFAGKALWVVYTQGLHRTLKVWTFWRAFSMNSLSLDAFISCSVFNLQCHCEVGMGVCVAGLSYLEGRGDWECVAGLSYLEGRGDWECVVGVSYLEGRGEWVCGRIELLRR